MLRDLGQDGLQDVNDGNGATMQMIWMPATMTMLKMLKVTMLTTSELNCYEDDNDEYEDEATITTTIITGLIIASIISTITIHTITTTITMTTTETSSTLYLSIVWSCLF